MRIVGGMHRGRGLRAPSSQAIRPTSDRLRETLFNILAHAYDNVVQDARVIDVFAGTGALGLEALSRGARFALFVDDGSDARALLRENIEILGFGGQTRIFRRDAQKLGAAPAGPPFNLAFIDPPYGKTLADAALNALVDGGWLAPGSLAIVEESANATLAINDAFHRLETRDFGETQLVFLKLL